MIKLAFYYFIFISIISAIAPIFDKISATRGGYRISENKLLALSAMGGSIAMYITMRIIHHKTRHNKFMIGIPIIILLQLLLINLTMYLL
ncbi:MAG: DUF1294 domain-containing protein [Clostridia bacterium]|nr:DUF1294 domain-containing protein [Clostridia bacterium]